MKPLKITLIFLLLQLFWSCSWVERFMVVNETDEPIEITYTIAPPEKTFAIFDGKFDVFQLKKAKQLDWEKKLDVVDLDTNSLRVHVKLPANAALIFGTLHNDKYTSTNQYFINGRSFNLVEMTISTPTKSTTVNPENFDTHFKKQNGSIVWVES